MPSVTRYPESIFRCTADLLPALGVAVRRAYADHYLHYWDPADNGRSYIRQSFSDEALQRDFADPNVLLYAVALDGELVGYMKLKRVGSPAELPELRGMELEKLYLQAAATGRGLGLQALGLAAQMALQSGHSVLWLKVMQCSPEAVRFYQRLGFRSRHQFRIDIAYMRDELRGMLIMALELTPIALAQFASQDFSHR